MFKYFVDQQKRIKNKTYQNCNRTKLTSYQLNALRVTIRDNAYT